MTTAAGLVLAGLLSGCAAQLTNRVYCSPDQRDLVFVSWWARLGLATRVDAADAKVLCDNSTGIKAPAKEPRQ